MSQIDEGSKVDGLSARQREILRLVAAHFERKEIASRLNISTHTVKAHIDAARKRLGVNTDRQAARLVAQHEGSGIPASIGHSLPEAMVQGQTIGLDSRDEEALRSQRQLYADQLAGTGHGPARVVGTGEASPDRGLYPNSTSALPDSRSGEGRHASGGNDGMAYGWRVVLGQRAKTLTITQCIVSIVVLAIVLAMGFVILVAGSAATMQAIQDLTGQTQ